MDTFMDKLSEKLAAQEMIRANMEADTEELNKLKEQVKIYDECITKVQQISKELQAVNQQISQMPDSTIAPELRKLTDKSIAKINELQSNSEDLEELKKLINDKTIMTNDNVHKECVKVYRNIQAVIAEENGKQTENTIDLLNKLTFKVNILTGISAVAMITGVASLALALFFII
ncbi:MAG: hypothetical protein IJF07_09340 [Lachnospiraceae bacterium]|nr:hypothetical protein [Lachnospiraceae bacterium]